MFELSFPNEAAAFTVRHELEQIFCYQIVPALERAFNEHVRGDTIHHIDRLEIDLGRMNAGRLDGVRIAEIVTRQLSDRFEELGSNSFSRRLDLTDSLVEALGEYLRSGSIPWNAAFQSVDEMERATSALSLPEATRLVARLRPRLRYRDAGFRLAHQFTPEFLEWIICLLHPESGQDLLAAGAAELRGVATADARAILLQTAAGVPRNAESKKFVLEVRRLSEDLHAGPATSVPSLIRPVDQARGLAVGDSIDVAVDTDDVALTDGTVGTEDVALAIRHAGIVLLHPFFQLLFRELGLVSERGRFQSRTAQTRAIHLLHHIATGRENPEEPETVLFKILCGVPRTRPITKVHPLDAHEREEIETLLTAAIRHWAKLGNTSPDALREEFLRRPGSLRQVQSGWKLAVEQRSVDVLLGSVPWNLSLVHLPWMKAPLHVDWA